MNLNKTINTMELHAREIAAKINKGVRVSNEDLKILSTYNSLQKAFDKLHKGK